MTKLKHLPSTLWGDMDHVQQVVEVKLRDGRILRPLLVDESGMLLGRVVGGQDGVVPLTENLETDDVIAVRRIDGILRSLGLSRWRTAGE